MKLILGTTGLDSEQLLIAMTPNFKERNQLKLYLGKRRGI